jgi:alpha/beta superfamily hydrolase
MVGGLKLESIAGPAGVLQLSLDLPPGQARALAIICHPHPLHGGSLNNKIVHQLARTFKQLGAVSVRFNFRGVGGSAGEYDEGWGEHQDLLTVAAWARERWPDLPLWLAGFSFGGFIAMQAAESLRPQRLVTVAPAVNYFAAAEVVVATADWLLIQGGADEIVPLDAVQSLVARVSPRPALVVVDGAGHFFHGRLNDLKQVVLDHFLTD